MSYQQPPGYGAPGYGQGQPMGDHPKAQTAMILGILGLVCCGIFTAIPAYIIGNNAVKEIDASGGQYGGRGMANAGKILGLIGIVLFVLGIIFYVILFAVAAGNS
jgi:tellurite resistance protein TehA-like permease